MFKRLRWCLSFVASVAFACSALAQTAGLSRSSWTSDGPTNIGGRVRSIVTDPSNGQNLWVGAVDGGIWKSSNGGASWQAVSNNDFLDNMAIGCMVMNPANHSFMYAGTGEAYLNSDSARGAGILRSTDGGNTWSTLQATQSWPYVPRIAISADGQVLLAATPQAADRMPLRRSTDGGVTWSSIQLPSNPYLTAVLFHPTDPLQALASSMLGQAYFSADGGMTWTLASGIPAPPANTAERVELAYSRSTPSIVYASVEINLGQVFKSTDGGQSYALVNDGTHFMESAADQGWYDNAIWVDPTDASRVIVGGMTIWMSTDGAQSFAQLTPSRGWDFQGPVHADQHIIVEDAGYGQANRAVWFGDDGGVFKAADITADPSSNGFWQGMNNGLAITQFYGVAVNSNGVVVSGAQDNCTERYAGNANGWTRCNGAYGDGAYSASDPTDPTIFYATYPSGGIKRSTDAGLNFVDIPPSNAGNGEFQFVYPILLDPNNANTLLMGGKSLWRTSSAKTESGGTWVAITTPNAGSITAIAIATGSSDVIWIGDDRGGVYVTRNGTSANPTWTAATLGVSGRPVNGITIDPARADIVYVCLSSFSTRNVWKTADGGGTWTDLTANGANGFPSLPANTLAIHPSNSSFLYVGTDQGVYASQDGGANWVGGNLGPANCRVSQLLFVGTKLYSATHGRGLFEAAPSATSGGGGSTPAITSPAAGSTLSGASVTFTWSAGTNVADYWLQIGTSALPAKYYNHDEGTGLQDTVTALPTDGSQVVARLWYRIGSTWARATDVTFTAANTNGGGGGSTPAITSPATGSTLSGATVTFVWSAGTNVAEYWLQIGTSAQATRYYNHDEGTNLQDTATGLPTDGSQVGARLWYRVASTWAHAADVTFTAASTNGGGGSTTPTITSPADGSTLSGSTVTFQWSAGTGVSQYWLQVYNAGGTRIYNQSQGTNLSLSLSGLPTDGSALVFRLWYFTDTWHSADTHYTAATEQGSAFPTMVSPTGGSTLTGSNVTFQWTQGTGVSQYWLQVFDAAGLEYNQSQGTNTSLTLSGIPMDGRALTLRLWYDVAGTWLFTDFQYTAAQQ